MKSKQVGFKEPRYKTQSPRDRTKGKKQRMTRDKHIGLNSICKWVKLIIRREDRLRYYWEWGGREGRRRGEGKAGSREGGKRDSLYSCLCAKNTSISDSYKYFFKKHTSIWTKSTWKNNVTDLKIQKFTYKTKMFQLYGKGHFIMLKDTIIQI